MASVQKHYDPWHPRLLDKTEAQLDLILEAYSVDHPKELRFERNKTRKARERPVQVLKGWADVLIGDAKQKLINQVSFKLPGRFTQTARTIPTKLPPVVTPRMPQARTGMTPGKAPRPAPKRR